MYVKSKRLFGPVLQLYDIDHTRPRSYQRTMERNVDVLGFCFSFSNSISTYLGLLTVERDFTK